MKKIISFVFLVVGFTLIGYGAFNFFESYDDYLEDINNEDIYTGLYFFQDESVSVIKKDNETLEITLNNETYEFLNDDNYFVNDILGLYVSFENESLIFSKDGAKVKVYYKEKK